jgi:RNA recognition motif-containing protein
MAVMKQTLLNLFKPYRPVKEIIAHENTRMRGQAFVTFPDVEIANKARREVGEFPLYGKPIVSSAQRASKAGISLESRQGLDGDLSAEIQDIPLPS